MNSTSVAKQPSQNPHRHRRFHHRFDSAIHAKSLKVISKTQANPLQTFTIIYNGEKYLVDPVSMSSSSLQFRTLIDPYISDPEKMKEIQLKIEGSQFSNRNMNNFLRLCQNFPTDVQNSEMEEICEIAAMFKAKEIYETGYNFIKNNLNPDFNVPDDKYDQSNFIIKSKEKLSDAYFEDTNNPKYDGNYYSINDDDRNNNAADISIIKSKKKITGNVENRRKRPSIQKLPVIYTINVKNHSLKCPTFKFLQKETVLFAAKEKCNDIFVAEGNEVHIGQKEMHIAHILQNPQNLLINTVYTKHNQFNIRYKKVGPNKYSIDTSIKIDEKNQSLVPKKPKFDSKKNRCILDCSGQYHLKVKPSLKNIVLDNSDGQTMFIVRKKDEKVFEVECDPGIEPLVAFCIAISDIVGPFYNDYNE